jgi:hypothetical protein
MDRKAMPTYRLKLHKSYFDKGFFNVPVSFDRFVSPSEGQIAIVLEEGTVLEARLDRTSNRNRTARIHGGRQLRSWLHANFKVHDELDVEFISPDVVRLQPLSDPGLFRRYDWHRLTRLQKDKFGEYTLKIELTLWGLDVFSSEIDTPGADLLVRIDPSMHLEIHARTVRGFRSINFDKERFSPRENLYAAIIILELYQPPKLYLIPSTVWLKPDHLFFSKEYEGMMSSPKWGINLSHKNLPLLDDYAFERIVGEWIRASS